MNTVGVIGAVFAVVLFLDGFLRWLLTHTPESGLSIVERARADRLGGTDQLALFDEALTTGVVPPGADRLRWLRELDSWNPRRTLSPENLLACVVILAFLWQTAAWAIPKSFDELLASKRTWWTGGVAVVGVLLFAGSRVRQRLRHPGESKVDERKRLRATLERESAPYRVVTERHPLVPLAGRRYRSQRHQP